MGYIILACDIGLAVSALASSQFNKIAEMKGHSGYFWWCFWLGAAGWAMVIALPDRSSVQPSPADDLPEL